MDYEYALINNVVQTHTTLIVCIQSYPYQINLIIILGCIPKNQTQRKFATFISLESVKCGGYIKMAMVYNFFVVTSVPQK